MSIEQKYFKYLRHLGKTVTLRTSLEESGRPDLVALRHDVDYDFDLALEMAYREHREGVQSTYFLLHTADYWHDSDFIDKALQLQDFGHEVALHNNLISNWFENSDKDLDTELTELLGRLRKAGLDIVGTSAHGDGLCYEKQFINYWMFSDLRSDKPEISEAGLNAEGIPSTRDRGAIAYPSSHSLYNDDGKALHLWSVPFSRHGLCYDAAHLSFDQYFSDSGGGWTRTADPLSVDLSTGRHQVLVHPEYWRGPQKIYFFLSTARSGSKWLANFLDTATPLRCQHEFSLNHRYDYKENELKPEKRTGHGFTSLVREKDFAKKLLMESRSWIETQKNDYAEANVYLERFIPQLKEVFPDATFVHLHRDPKDVVRSIMNRNWYDLPDDDKHPVMEVNGWNDLSQFEKLCWYDRVTNESLLDFCQHRIVFEQMVEDLEYLKFVLDSIGIPLFPRMAEKVFADIVNANINNSFQGYECWDDEQKGLYHGILWPIVMELGYASADYEEVLGLWLRKYIEKKVQDREKSYQKSQAVAVAERFAEIVFSQEKLQKFNAIGCALKFNNETLMITPEGGRHVTIVLGGGGWYEINASEGWENKTGYYISGRLSGYTLGEGTFQLFCLMYGEDGMQIEKRSLGICRQGNVTLDFSYRPVPEAVRFNLAIYASKESLPQKIFLECLTVERCLG